MSYDGLTFAQKEVSVEDRGSNETVARLKRISRRI